MVTKMIIIKNKNIFSCSYIITFLWYQNQPNWLTIMWSHLHDFYLNRHLRYIVANILWRNDQTISITIKYAPLSYRTGGNRKRSEQSMNAVHKSLETVFSIAICRQSRGKWQSKTLLLMILDIRSSIVLTFSIAAYLRC